MKRDWPKPEDLTHKEIEKAEEETGIDIDKDGEKGESQSHKDKVKKKAHKKFKEWVEQRDKK